MTKYTSVDINRMLEFRGNARDELKAFPAAPRRAAGTELQRAQADMAPLDSKSMRSIGKGVREIRVKDEQGAYRVIYISSIGQTVYVLHAFKKKSQKTPKKNLDTAKERLKDLRQELRTKKVRK